MLVLNTLAAKDPELAPPVRPVDPGSPPSLGNVAGTCLELMGFAVPEGYLPSMLVTTA